MIQIHDYLRHFHLELCIMLLQFRKDKIPIDVIYTARIYFPFFSRDKPQCDCRISKSLRKNKCSNVHVNFINRYLSYNIVVNVGTTASTWIWHNTFIIDTYHILYWKSQSLSSLSEMHIYIWEHVQFVAHI